LLKPDNQGKWTSTKRWQIIRNISFPTRLLKFWPNLMKA
jgi:hypothetical protein